MRQGAFKLKLAGQVGAAISVLLGALNRQAHSLPEGMSGARISTTFVAMFRHWVAEKGIAVRSVGYFRGSEQALFEVMTKVRGE